MLAAAIGAEITDDNDSVLRGKAIGLRGKAWVGGGTPEGSRIGRVREWIGFGGDSTVSPVDDDDDIGAGGGGACSPIDADGLSDAAAAAAARGTAVEGGRRVDGEV